MKNKNIIYKLAGVVILLLIGEGVFGWAVYWPALWFLLDFRYVYWLALGLGLLLAGLTGLGLGWASLVLVVGVWLMSFLREWVGKNNWLDVLVVVVIAWLANLVLLLKFSLVEAVVIALVVVFWKIKGKQGGDIRV